MRDIIQQINDAIAFTEKCIQENPNMTSIWYNFSDLSMDELRNIAKEFDVKVKQDRDVPNRMYIHFPSSVSLNAVIFCYSNDLAVTEHVVTDTIVRNI